VEEGDPAMLWLDLGAVVVERQVSGGIRGAVVEAARGGRG
jgi:hypothetical protein